MRNILQKDNTTLKNKINLRKQALKQLTFSPYVLECYGGKGGIYKKVYAMFPGIVFEKDAIKIKVLVEQRKTWRVYNSDCVESIKNGACDNLALNFFDVDPYGDPWLAIGSILNSKIDFSEKIVFCVNDGLRKKAQLGGAWSSKSLEEYAQKYGNSEIYKNYLQICKEIMIKKAIVSMKYYDKSDNDLIVIEHLTFLYFSILSF